jgi:superfamily II DNA or RNA helicase
MTDITPRYYQQYGLEALDESVQRGIKRNAIVSATGTGKTILGCLRIKKKLSEGKKCLILVDQRLLAYQWKYDLIKVIPNVKIGIEMSTTTASKNDDVVIATVQTLGRKGKKRIKKFGPIFDFVICDEVHKSPTPTWMRALEYFGVGQDNFHSDKELLGLTATFYRNDDVSLGKLFDDVAYKYPIKDALRDGWLTDIEHYPVSTKTDISKIQSYKDDFNLTQLSDRLNNPVRNSLIVKSYKEISGGEKAVCYTANVKHAYDLQKVFEHHGINAQVIEANTDEDLRKQWVDEFKSKTGDIDVLLNFGTLTTGFNAPEATTLILARPIKSQVLYVQIIGRGLRPSSMANVDLWDGEDEKELRRTAIDLSDKPACKLIDLCDVWGSHEIATPVSLFGLNNEMDTRKKKRIFKEVVEPLDELKAETGMDVSTIVDIDDIDMIVQRNKVDITKHKTPTKIRNLTNKRWMELENGGYELPFRKEDKILIIERDESKQLLGKEGHKLMEYDMKSKITKELNTFNSLEGAFNIADQYIDQQGWDTTFKERRGWMDAEPTEKQIALLLKLYTYRKGQANEFCEFKRLNKRYKKTGHRMLKYKKTKEIVDAELASELIDQKFNS